MPNYEVGNLEIKFSALNEIDFEKLKDGLNKVKSAINNIGKIDTGRLDNFSKILSSLSTQFLPFLQGVEKASGGLAVFNDTLRQVGGRGGARGLSAAVAEFENIKKYTQEEVAIAEQLGVNLREATEEQLAQIQAIIENSRRLEEQRRIIGELTNRYATYRDEFYRASREKPAILEDINTTKAAIQEAQQELNQLKTQFVVVGENLGFNEETSQFAQEITAEIQSMEGVIDNLKVHLADLQSQFGAPFNEAQRAVSALKNELLNVYYATNTINEGQVQQAQELINKINETQRAIDRRFMSTQEQVIADQKEAIAKNQLEIAYLKAQQGLGLLNMTQEQYIAELQRLEAEQRRLRGEIEETNDTQKETEKQTKKTTSGWKKFLNQVKRIAIYRLIRTALKAVVNTFKDTINAFAEVDDGVNNTVSNITSSFSIIKLGLGSTIMPILQAIEPIVNQIAISFANLGNAINAALSTDGKYTKINTQAWQDYREQINKTSGALLDFDKFRVLNQKEKSLSDFLEPNQDVKDLNKELGASAWQWQLIAGFVGEISETLSIIFETVRQIFEAVRPFLAIAMGIVGAILNIANGLLDILNKSGLLKPIIGAILGYLVAIAATKIITWLGSGKLGTFLTNLISKINGTNGALLNVLATNQALAVGIGALAGSLFYFISSLDKMGTTAKIVIPIISALAAVLTGVAVARAAAAAGIAAPIKAGITAAALAAAITLAAGTAISVAVGKYAEGGLPDKGTMFIAGEAGAEMVYNMPSGQSGVANVSQIEQAFYNALVQYGRENNGETINVNVNLDGQQLYRSVERAAGQRGLGFARK